MRLLVPRTGSPCFSISSLLTQDCTATLEEPNMDIFLYTLERVKFMAFSQLRN